MTYLHEFPHKLLRASGMWGFKLLQHLLIKAETYISAYFDQIVSNHIAKEV